MLKKRSDRRRSSKILWRLFAVLFCLFGVGNVVIHAAEKTKFGIKQTLTTNVEGSGTSYLKYTSPISGKALRVSLHKTSTDLMAYCLDRTKDSDHDDFNYNYTEVKNYSQKASDLQRNILLCGYPGNTVSKLKIMYGFDTNARCAAQATQMAIWICNYMYDENVTMSEAWNAHNPKNTGDYKALGLSKAILNRAYDMLNQKLTLSYENKGEKSDLVTYDFIIETEGQYYPLIGSLSGLPEGCQVSPGQGVTHQQDGSVEVNLVKGKTSISLTFSKYVEAKQVTFCLNGTVPVPKDYAGILYYENSDSKYQSVVVVKEANPTYEEKKSSFSRKADSRMQIRIKKEDSSGKGEQGDATLVGAQYTIFDSKGTKKEVLTIGEKKEATSGALPVDLYTVKETKSPKGYNLDPTVYTVDGTKGDGDVLIQNYDVLSKEDVIKGKVRIIKNLENPDSGSEEKIPAKGVVFTYYLDSNPDVKMEIPLNEEGVGESDWMPYGTYTLEETKTPDGWKAVAPIHVTIQKEGEILPYYIEDPVDSSGCKIIKKDADTGENIAFSGTRFQIRKKNTEEIVSMYVENEAGQKTKVSEFLTNGEGYLVLPEKLQAGTYLLYELEAPTGYLRKEEPQEFKVPYHFDGTVEIIMENTPILCQLQVIKTGFTMTKKESVQWESYEVTKPVWESKPLSKVTYCLTAKEDIVTLDQTVRMKKGEQIIKETDEEGIALFEGLYPGIYELLEQKTVDGYVLDEEPKEIKLEPENDQDPIKKEEYACENMPQRLNLLLKKQMEQKEEHLFEDALKEVLFGVYTKDAVKNRDGEIIIEKDTLVDLYQMDEEGKGYSLCKTELPYGSYYVKELKTHPEYQLDETLYEFSFSYQDEWGKEQEISLWKEPLINYQKPEETTTGTTEEITTEISEETTTVKPEETTTEKKEEPKNKAEKKKTTPKTGDKTDVFLWGLMAVTSGCVLLAFFFHWLKKRITDQAKDR